MCAVYSIIIGAKRFEEVLTSLNISKQIHDALELLFKKRNCKGWGKKNAKTSLELKFKCINLPTRNIIVPSLDISLNHLTCLPHCWKSSPSVKQHLR